MWLSDKWKDYELIDCGDGERLERWGKYILIRPDPQAIWHRSSNDKRWKTADGHYIRSDKGGGHWEGGGLPECWSIGYDSYVFKIKPMNFKHTGIFPEQASNWDFIKASIKSAARRVNVINLFAYTGGATIAAASAGASVCHVDAAKNMVAQAKENAALSKCSDAEIRYIVDDCKKFIERELRRGHSYDGIIMDPPSYGRGPSGEIWKFETDIYDFVELASRLLSDNPLFFILNSYSAGLSPASMNYIVSDIIGKKHKGKIESMELGLPVTASGLALPAGSTVRWLYSRSNKN